MCARHDDLPRLVTRNALDAIPFLSSNKNGIGCVRVVYYLCIYIVMLAQHLHNYFLLKLTRFNIINI